MNNLSLSTMNNNNTTTVSNVFIDEFMPLANGEFTKIYLYLLRCISNGKTNISIDCLADFFNQTEADIMCALRYWDKAGVLIASTDSTGRQITGITFCNLDSASGSTPDNSSAQLNSNQMPSNHIPSNHMHAEQSTDIYNAAASDTEVPITPDSNETCDPRSAYTPKQLEDLSEQEDFSMLLYAAQTYLGSVLNSSDASVIAYLYDSLQFSSELIEYLIEYCVSNGHKSMRYIEKVAINWADEEIFTHEQAEAKLRLLDERQQAWHTVEQALSIERRSPTQREIEYANRWVTEWKFPAELLHEAYERCVDQTGKVNLRYINKILENWQQKGVRSLEQARQEQTEKAAQQPQKQVTYDIDSFEKSGVFDDLTWR